MTDAHFRAASEMKNFSGWVRGQLDLYIQRLKDEEGQLMTYCCEKCESEFQKPPTNSRAKGLYFPSTSICPECGESSMRWDLI